MQSTRFRTRLLGLFLAGLVLFTPSCSVFASRLQTVTIRASHPQAEIYVDGQFLGKGTVSADLERDRSHAVTAKVGDRTSSAHIDTTVSGTGVLDIIGGFIWLVPFVGLFSSGFWSLETSSVEILVPPAQY